VAALCKELMVLDRLYYEIVGSNPVPRHGCMRLSALSAGRGLVMD
jgi:hypothetical protein